MNLKPDYIYWIVIGYATLWAFLKQRGEYGCSGSLFTTRKQCIDENSVYFVDSGFTTADSPKDLSKKVSSLLGYHEKSGIWKVCIVMAGVLTLFVWAIFPNGTNSQFISLHLTFFSLLYFYFNFINYHHFRRLKAAGDKILDAMVAKCSYAIV